MLFYCRCRWNQPLSAEPKEVPVWASDTQVQAALPDLAQKLQAQQDGKAVLVKTNEGWVHQQDFNE